MEEEKKHLEFMNAMKKFESDSVTDGEEKMEIDASKSSHSLHDLGFPDDEDDGGEYPQPTPASQMAASASAGYEIPARLRTLHNLVS